LKEYDLWELLEKVVVPLTDPQDLVAHEKKEIKVERVNLDSVKYHLISHLFEKKTTQQMFDSLVKLFQRTKMNKKMVLRNKIRSM